MNQRFSKLFETLAIRINPVYLFKSPTAGVKDGNCAATNNEDPPIVTFPWELQI